MLNILKNDDEINSYDKEIKGTPLCIQDLLNHPTLADPVYSIFKENVRAFQIAYFDKQFFNPNWKQELGLDEWAYEA